VCRQILPIRVTAVNHIMQESAFSNEEKALLVK
jgi:hypothetical protein